MSLFIKPQSGYLMPNSVDGLVVWIDASETGTLSRVGMSAQKIYDKCPGGNAYIVATNANRYRPKILQSGFNGNTVLKFNGAHQFFVGGISFDPNIHLTTIVIRDGQLVVDCDVSVCVHHGELRIPCIDSIDGTEIGELLVYDTSKLIDGDVELVCDYLKGKWGIE